MGSRSWCYGLMLGPVFSGEGPGSVRATWTMIFIQSYAEWSIVARKGGPQQRGSVKNRWHGWGEKNTLNKSETTFAFDQFTVEE
jgi:hypothetical protein